MTTKEQLYNELFLQCFKEQNIEAERRFKIKLIFYNHVIIYNEEPNIVAKYFLENQYDSTYTLESRSVNVNLDGDYTDVEFFESRLKNGSVGHIEFDMNSYSRSKIYYVMDKVIQPMIETQDIGKIMDTRLEKRKILFLKNLDMVLKNTNDDKIIKKITNWLDRYVETTNFLFSFNLGFTALSRTITSRMIPIGTLKIKNSSEVNNRVQNWILTNYNVSKNIDDERDIRSFYGFRYFIRYLIIEEYYSDLYELIDNLRNPKWENKKKFMAIRDTIIYWLQEGKNHNELIHEIMFYINYLDIPDKLKIRYIHDLSSRAKYTENSKKIIYHLENALSTFID
jgi:hypothetical protein